MSNYSGYRKDIIDYSDGFTDGYTEGCNKAVLMMRSLVEEVLYELGYDDDTSWEIRTNLFKKVQDTDFLCDLDDDLYGHTMGRNRS